MKIKIHIQIRLSAIEQSKCLFIMESKRYIVNMNSIEIPDTHYVQIAMSVWVCMSAYVQTWGIFPEKAFSLEFMISLKMIL